MLHDESAHPVLFVESGKDLGREFTLQEGETSVGRGIDNDIILTDVSVSRKHMRVVCDHEGITLVDLGSGNGTTLNGRRVHRALLGEGDRIEIGETVLVARLPGGAKPALYQQPTMAAPVEATSDEQLPSAEIQAPAVAPWPAYPASYTSAAPPPDRTPTRGTNILLGRGTLLLGAALLVMIASMIGAIAMALLLHEEPITGVVGSSPTAMPLPPVTTVGTPPGTSSIPGVATLGHPAPTPPTTAQPVPGPMPPATFAAMPPTTI
ncbi:MAG: FHA domain-containing protein, partial [Sandaracinaceae bacterium]|nr:FHA domain-containing protein [Sandaracinaceae bacterium]